MATGGALLTTLAHPHLVARLRVVTAPRPAVVLETLPGATLAALIDDRRLGVADTALLGRKLVSVLGYLHRQGWVHLDVKPDNVVVQEGRAVLIDLGLATRPGRIERGMGTDGYAAPEQDAGGTVSEATDAWGLAATLVECVTGTAPGRQPDLARVPASLRPLLAACLQPDPASGRPSNSSAAARRAGWRSRRADSAARVVAFAISTTMRASTPMTRAGAQQQGVDHAADPPHLGLGASAELSVARVDLPHHPVAHHPRERRDEPHTTTEDAEDEHHDRLRVIRRGEAVGRGAVRVRRVVAVRRLAGRRRLRHGDILPPPGIIAP